MDWYTPQLMDMYVLRSFSALKVQGKRVSDLAREGTLTASAVPVPRPVTVYSLELLSDAEELPNFRVGACWSDCAGMLDRGRALSVKLVGAHSGSTCLCVSALFLVLV